MLLIGHAGYSQLSGERRAVVALSDVAVLLMQKCEAWYKASQARRLRDGEPVLVGYR